MENKKHASDAAIAVDVCMYIPQQQFVVYCY